jgi:hypothetical protein
MPASLRSDLFTSHRNDPFTSPESALLLPWTGSAADSLNQRKLLMATQATMGVLALALGSLTIASVVQLWQVYAFAFPSGRAAALDAPVRQTFIAEMVGGADLPNAVALNSISFHGESSSRPMPAFVIYGPPMRITVYGRSRHSAARQKPLANRASWHIGVISGPGILRSQGMGSVYSS